MFTRDLKDCEEFISGDNTLLRQLLHPDYSEADIRYSLCHAVVRSGKSSLLHVLKTSEVYYILSGAGVMHIDEEEATVSAGNVIYIPPFSRQYIENKENTDLVFLCIVDPAWKVDNEQILA